MITVVLDVPTRPLRAATDDDLEISSSIEDCHLSRQPASVATECRSRGLSINELRALEQLSFRPLDEGENGLRQMLAWLDETGFELVWLEPGLWDQASEHLMRVDGIFERAQG